ncbi:MAG: hypothetical protein ACKOSS_01990, partial [Planctomycetia bacterium]
MRGLYSGLALWNLVVLAVTAVLGVVSSPEGPVTPEAHKTLGLFAAVFCCLVHSILVTHFIGSMKWIQQTGPTAGIEDTQVLRRAWMKGRAFPMLCFAMLSAVGAAILGGGAASGLLGLLLHATASLAVFPLNVLAMLWGREAIVANSVRMQAVEKQALSRQAAGLVQEAQVDALRPESGRAGGKTLLFLAANVWVLWFYRRHVLRLREEPLWPYAVGCALLAFLGWRLLKGFREQAPTTVQPTTVQPTTVQPTTVPPAGGPPAG